MGFFSKLFGQKNKNGSDQTKADPSVSDEKHDLKIYQDLIDHIVVPQALAADLKAKVKRAFEDPRSFYDEEAEFILSDRGLVFPDDLAKTPKFVMIDTLLDQDQMAEIDWKEDEPEVRYAVNRILKAKNYTTISDDLKYEDLDTFEVLNKINDYELRMSGYALEILDIDSDSYVFTIVPTENHQKVSELFLKLK